MAAEVDVNEAFSCTTARDLRDLILGDYMMTGTHRIVYGHAADDTCVIKMERYYNSFRNVMEWEVWKEVRDTPFARWFAPILAISANGRFIVQKRTTPLPKEKLPTEIPAFMADIKAENWGLYKGKPICHDYANNLLIAKGMTNRLKKADWR